MNSLEAEIPVAESGAQAKICEYADRIEAGEPMESIMQGLGGAFRDGIEKELVKREQAKKEKTEERMLSPQEAKEHVNIWEKQSLVLIPPQYDGLDSETLDFIWTIPEYVDPEKTKQEHERKRKAIAYVQEQEARKEEADSKKVAEYEEIKNLRTELKMPPLLNLEERKKITGWSASYELARIAKQQGINLAEFSREAYADFAVKNSLAIDDDQLRVAPWQRMGTSPQEILQEKKKIQEHIDPAIERAFEKFSFTIKELSAKPQKERWLDPEIRVLSGTQGSNSWLHFAINNAEDATSGKTHKAYISLKDLNLYSEEKLLGFMHALRDAGYQGQLKTFQDIRLQGPALNDQIVMHGNTEEDAEKALKIAEAFFGDSLEAKSVGADDVVDGKNMSYSQILAKKITDSISAQ